MLSRLLEFLLGGTPGLNAAEGHLLCFLLEALPPGDRGILSRQLQAIRKVQRQHPGRLVAVYYTRGHAVPKLPYPGDEYCLAAISYRSGRRTRTSSLLLHDGRFSTLERNVPTNLGQIDALVSVVLHPRGFESVAEEIDREEHEGARDG